jgi:hypothetical protein
MYAQLELFSTGLAKNGLAFAVCLGAQQMRHFSPNSKELP